MASGKITIGKQAGGKISLVVPNGLTNSEVLLPDGGELVTKEYVDSLKTIAMGSAIFTNSTNNINLTGVGVGVEVGDVIIITGSTNNNLEFTVEVITDNNNIIVNQAHSGKSRTVDPIGLKALVNETATITVKLLAKYYNASSGLGQDWVNVTASRVNGTNYTNNTNREIFITYTATQVGAGSSIITVSGQIVIGEAQNQVSGEVSLSLPILKGNTYSIGGSNTKRYCWEKR